MYIKTLSWLLSALLLQAGVLWPWQPVAVSVPPQTELNRITGNLGLHSAGLAATAPENEQLQAHLHYVINRLTKHRPADLSEAQIQKRAVQLRHLRRYAESAHFPRQRAYAGRRPRLIDDRGHLCAVGYLISRSGHPELIQRLNQQYEYAYLQEMADPELTSWVTNSGFSLEELAMVQPAYGGGSSFDMEPGPSPPHPFAGLFMPLAGGVSALLSLVFFATGMMLEDDMQRYSVIAAESSMLLAGSAWMVTAVWGNHDVAAAGIWGALGLLLGMLGGMALWHSSQALWQPRDLTPPPLAWGMIQRPNNAYLGVHYALAF